MKFIDNLTIKKKLILTVMAVSGITAVVGFSAVIFYQIKTYREDIVNNLNMQAKLVSQYCISPLTFEDKRGANDVLARLRTVPAIVTGEIYDEEGRLFAAYANPENKHIVTKLSLNDITKKQVLIFRNDFIHISSTIVYNNQFYGTLYLIASTDEMRAGINRYLVMMAGIMVALLVLTYLLALYMQGFISRPVLKLAGFTNEVSSTGDYGLRIAKKGNDEIGILYEGFNKMLEQINKREKERDSAEKKLRESENKNRTLIEAIPDMIYILDKTGRLSYFKTNDERMLPVPAEKIIGSRLEERGHSFEDARQIRSYIEKSIRTRKMQTFERETVTLKGMLFYEFRLVALNNDEVVVLIRDLTEQKEAKQELEAEKIKSAAAREADKLKSAFLANMSHEIRTPMNAIIGFANLLRDEELADEEKQEFINIINSSGEHLVRLIDDIIDISKIEAGQMVIKKAECSINTVLAELYAFFDKQKALLDKKHITLCLNIPDKEHGLMMITDAQRFKQIFTNLISNAIKFTEKGMIEFGYTTMLPAYMNDKIRSEQSYITFYVKDSGIGIPQHQHDEIFKRFRKLEDHRTKLYGGAGLGLAICQNLVNALDGEIWLESSPLKGSTFFFALPYLTYSNVNLIFNERIKNFTEMEKKYLWKDKNILIVEDEDYVCKFLERVIIPTQANILWARNGLAAVDMCKTDLKIDVVLMDMKLPELNGYEAVKRIKAHNKNLHIIAQTAYAMSEDRDMCIEAGCDDYICKPIDPETLLEKINAAISRTN